MQSNDWLATYISSTETGLYYLNSRYYDPNTGRYLNADGTCGESGNLLSTNMFAYCMNNPVNMSDPSGCWPKWSTILTVVAVVAITVAVVAVCVATCGAAVPALALAGGGMLAGGGLAAAATTVGLIAAGTAVVAAGGALLASKAENSAGKSEPSAKSRNKPKEQGTPNSSELHKDQDGNLDGYTTYGPDGEIEKQVRLTGKDHGNIPRPNVKEPDFNIN